MKPYRAKWDGRFWNIYRTSDAQRIAIDYSLGLALHWAEWVEQRRLSILAAH